MMTDEDTGAVDSDWDSVKEALSSFRKIKKIMKTRSSKSVGNPKARSKTRNNNQNFQSNQQNFTYEMS